MCICHRCDVRSCVNPDHLFLGTASDNTQDMIKKKRGVFQKNDGGESHPLHKLNLSDVKQIKNDNILKKINYEAPKRPRGRPKKNPELDVVKIPKAITTNTNNKENNKDNKLETILIEIKNKKN